MRGVVSRGGGGEGGEEREFILRVDLHLKGPEK